MRTDPLTRGLWDASAPPPPDTAALEGDARADVVVVGGGFTGCSAALHLAEAGAAVVLLEGADIGFGGSGRNVGLVNAGLWLPPAEIEAALGTEAGMRLNEALGRAPALVFELIERHGIACEAVRNGTLHLAHAPAGQRELERRHAQLSARGAPVVLLDRDEAARRVGSTAFHGALFDPRAGTIQPLAYARGLARAAIAAGARLHTRSPVRSIERQGRGWRVTAAGGTVTADRVILATNAYTGPLLPALTAALTPIHYFQFATAPLPDAVRRGILPGLEGSWDTASVMSSFRLDRAGRLVVGSIGRLDHPGARIHEAWARRVLGRVFPQAAGAPLEFGWFGRIGMTPDHIPRFFEPEPGLTAFFGYNGRGIGPGTVFGRALAFHALGRDDHPLPMAPSDVGPVPFRRVKEMALEAGACGYHAARTVA
ncbi:FAD-binding oxidoreductase [Azospirillum sp. SYSU D00513]|uniref:NAD(P)/FAD-dependent oxidoreductase n=1 Tax=Azospirillum sp. SYSU D00513 TaxID=2812561 RepID=UPI001A956E6C|nr:FAD-binding oxidoreductase [Azospirillum sp. SYSU D00513]